MFGIQISSLHFIEFKSVAYVFLDLLLYRFFTYIVFIYIHTLFEQVYVNTRFAIFSFEMGYVSMNVCETSHIDWVAKNPSKAYGSEEGLVLNGAQQEQGVQPPKDGSV